MTVKKIERFFLALLLITIAMISTPGLYSLPIELFKFFGLLLTIVFIINLNNNIIFLKKIPNWFILLIFYWFILQLSSFLISFEFTKDIRIDISERYITQLISLTTRIVIGFYLFKYTLIDLDFIKRYLFIGFYIILIFALLQIIGTFTHTFNWGAAGYGFNFILTRVCSISGEPKMMASFMLPFIIYFIYISFRGNKFIKIIALFIYFKSYSISSYLTFIFASALVFMNKRRLIQSLIVILIVFAGLFTILSSNEDLYDKTIGRVLLLFSPELNFNPEKTVVHFPIIDSDIVVDATEAPSFELVFHHPLLWLSGVGFGMESVYSYLYFNSNTAGFHGLDYTGILSPNNALLRNSLYFGLPFVLFILFRIVSIGRILIHDSKNKTFIFFGILIVVSTISNLLIFSNNLKTIPLFFLAEGLRQRYKQEGIL